MNNSENPPVSWPAAARGMAKITLATLAFASWHSLLCSSRAKEGAKTWLGQKRGAAYYRAFFMGQSVVTAGALIVFVLAQPHRTLYRAKGAARILGWSGQALALLVGVLALRDLDKAKFTGAKGVHSFKDGEEIVEAEAQGPDIENDGAIRAQGVYRYSRHPIEWAPILLLFATPTMKTNWLAFDILAAIYSYFGARHEEKRLLEKSSEAYATYQRQVSFFVGWPRQNQ